MHLKLENPLILVFSDNMHGQMKPTWSVPGSHFISPDFRLPPGFSSLCHHLGEMVNQVLEPRAESQATSQEAHRLLEKGQMLHLQYMAFSEFYLRFLFGIFCLWQCGFSFRTEKEAKIIHNQSERMLQLRLGASAWLPFYCSYCFSKAKPIIYALLQPQQQCRDGHVLITNFRLRFRTFQCTLLLIRSSEQSLFLITFLSFPPLNNPLPHLCSCLPEV